jgi:mono/diheme cytochrome c family protein
MRSLRHCHPVIGALLWSCSSAPVAPADAGVKTDAAEVLEIVTTSGSSLTANAGDAVQLMIVQRMGDGTSMPLPSGAKVTWTKPATVTALDPSSTASSPVPQPGSHPTAFFIDNPGRPDRNADLAGVVFITDPGTAPNGTVPVSATVTGVPSTGPVTTTITVGPVPVGSATNGAKVFGSAGANCAFCHGATGDGSTMMAKGATDADPDYVIADKDYPYPAPGLNAEPGNDGSDPAWNAALFAMAARADMDNGGLTLRLPMPDWLTQKIPGSTPPTTQDLVDIYAFMKTQTH